MSWCATWVRAASRFAALGALITGLTVAASADAGGSNESHTTTFKVGARVLHGQPKTICVLQGSWADGEPLRFETWDECSKMRVSSARPKDYRDAPQLGDGDKATAEDIPENAEVLQVSNDFSTVLIFREAAGKVQELLVKD